jgi:hypothetical protein
MICRSKGRQAVVPSVGLAPSVLSKPQAMERSMEQEAIALFEQNLTNATTEVQRRTVEELRVLMRRNLPWYLHRFYGPKRKRKEMSALAELRAAIDDAYRCVLDKNPNGRARFFVNLIVRDHLNQLIRRAIDDYPDAFTIHGLTEWLFDYASRAREELYPSNLRPEMPTRRKLSNMVMGYLRRGGALSNRRRV